MLQTQCPNCGGYKVETLRSYPGKKETPETTRLEARQAAMVRSKLFVVIFFWLNVVFFIGSVWVNSNANAECTATPNPSCFQVLHNSEIAFNISQGLFVVWLLVIVIRWLARRSLDQMIDSSYASTGVLYFDFKCELCGYRWHWGTNESKRTYPAGTVNTHLMALGEDLQRREQAQRTAAAAAYEQQRREHERRGK